jgi:anti-anti-sigma factor
MNANSVKINGDTITIVTAERLDANNTPQLLDELKGNAGKKFRQVIFDCHNLVYVSSAGLRPMIFSKQQLVPDGEVIVTGVSEAVLKVIKMVGFDSFLTIKNE